MYILASHGCSSEELFQFGLAAFLSWTQLLRNLVKTPVLWLSLSVSRICSIYAWGSLCSWDLQASFSSLPFSVIHPTVFSFASCWDNLLMPLKHKRLIHRGYKIQKTITLYSCIYPSWRKMAEVTDGLNHLNSMSWG